MVIKTRKYYLTGIFFIAAMLVFSVFGQFLPIARGAGSLILLMLMLMGFHTLKKIESKLETKLFT